LYSTGKTSLKAGEGLKVSRDIEYILYKNVLNSYLII